MKNVFKTGVVVFSLAALALTGCKKDDFVKPEELNEYVKKTDGGYIMGTITGTRVDGTDYSFPFEYLLNSSSEYSVSTSSNDKIVSFYVNYKKDNMLSDYLKFAGSLNFTKKTFVSFGDVDGYLSQLISSDKRFVYQFDYDTQDMGIYNWSNITYDENAEMLNADFVLDMPNNNVLGYENSKATKITGKLSFFLSKDIVNSYPNVYFAPGK